MKLTLWFTFAGLVVLANALTARYGFVFGLATAGTFAAGLTFAVRDLLHEAAGRAWVLSAIGAGALLSVGWIEMFGTGGAPIEPWRLASASGTAFAFAELADYAVYAPLRRRSVGMAALLSNTVGAIADSALFLTLVGWFAWHDVTTQSLIKVAVTLPVVAGMAVLLRARRAVSA